MRDPRINFRSRELAALLAFLIPGTGHLYQGRHLKAGIYFGGILSLFFAGMALGDWQPVYSQVAYASRPGTLQMQPREAKLHTNSSIGYAAQFFVGLPAIPSLIQQTRFANDEGVVTTLRSEIDSDFVGVFRDRDVFVPVSGRIIMSPGQLGSGVGKFEGTTNDGSPATTEISGSVDLGREVFGSPRREISVSGLSNVTVAGTEPYELRGTISRPFINWFQAPRDDAELDRLHGKLSQNFDIACVFTWIAGLLNLMAIWDAYDGPAYGYGDEEPEDDDESEQESE
jgi:hypothetical protein